MTHHPQHNHSSKRKNRPSDQLSLKIVLTDNHANGLTPRRLPANWAFRSISSSPGTSFFLPHATERENHRVGKAKARKREQQHHLPPPRTSPASSPVPRPLHSPRPSSLPTRAPRPHAEPTNKRSREQLPRTQSAPLRLKTTGCPSPVLRSRVRLTFQHRFPERPEAGRGSMTPAHLRVCA